MNTITKTATKDIDGLTFTTTLFPATYALGLVPRLQAWQEDKTGISDEGIRKLFLDVLRQTKYHVPGTEARIGITDHAKMDDIFTGRLGTMLKVFAFAVEVNFPNEEGSAPKGDAPSTESTTAA